MTVPHPPRAARLRRRSTLAAVVVAAVAAFATLLAGAPAGAVGEFITVTPSSATAHGWSDPRASVGGTLIGPMAVSDCGGQQVAFARGIDNGLWYASAPLGTTAWRPWVRLPSNIVQAPATVTSDPAATCRLVVVGMGNRIYESTYAVDGSGSVQLAGWVDTGGLTGSAVGVAVIDDAFVDSAPLLVAQGIDLGVYVRRGTGGWTPLGGRVLFGPGVVASSHQYYGVGSDLALYVSESAPEFDPEPAAWSSYGGVLTGAVTVRSLPGVGIVAAGRGADGGLWWNCLSCPPGAGAGWHPLGGIMTDDAPDIGQLTGPQENGTTLPVFVVVGADGREWSRRANDLGLQSFGPWTPL